MPEKPADVDHGSTKSAVEHLKEARLQQGRVITAKQLDLIKARIEQDEIGGKEDCLTSLEEIVKTHPGIALATVRGVYPDQKALTKAKAALIKAGKIHEVTNKQAVNLKPGSAPIVAEEKAT